MTTVTHGASDHAISTAATGTVSTADASDNNAVIRNRFGELQPKQHLGVQFWDSKWKKEQTNWHLQETHQYLSSFGPAVYFRPPSESPHDKPVRVLVPLCGKSVDLIWLSQRGYEVVGVEYVEQGIRQFFSEHASLLGEPVETQVTATIRSFRSAKLPVTVFQSDFFDASLTPEAIGGFVDHIWDRGSFIAINRTDRVRYMNKCEELTQAAHALRSDTSASSQRNPFCATHLLAIVCYPQWKMVGPPFSVSHQQLLDVYQHVCRREPGESVPNVVPEPPTPAAEQQEIAESSALPSNWQSVDQVVSTKGVSVWSGAADGYVIRLLDVRPASISAMPDNSFERCYAIARCSSA